MDLQNGKKELLESYIDRLTLYKLKVFFIFPFYCLKLENPKIFCLFFPDKCSNYNALVSGFWNKLKS